MSDRAALIEANKRGEERLRFQCAQEAACATLGLPHTPPDALRAATRRAWDDLLPGDVREVVAAWRRERGWE